MGADTPARTEPATHRCPRARPTRRLGYHLAIARRPDPCLEAEHQAAAGAAPVPDPSSRGLARMDGILAWVSAEGRLPDGRSGDRGERSMARWLSGRRREAAGGTLGPTYSAGLVRMARRPDNSLEAGDEARWYHRLAPPPRP